MLLLPCFLLRTIFLFDFHLYSYYRLLYYSNPWSRDEDNANLEVKKQTPTRKKSVRSTYLYSRLSLLGKEKPVEMAVILLGFRTTEGVMFYNNYANNRGYGEVKSTGTVRYTRQRRAWSRRLIKKWQCPEKGIVCPYVFWPKRVYPEKWYTPMIVGTIQYNAMQYRK